MTKVSAINAKAKIQITSTSFMVAPKEHCSFCLQCNDVPSSSSTEPPKYTTSKPNSNHSKGQMVPLSLAILQFCSPRINASRKCASDEQPS